MRGCWWGVMPQIGCWTAAQAGRGGLFDGLAAEVLCYFLLFAIDNIDIIISCHFISLDFLPFSSVLFHFVSSCCIFFHLISFRFISFH
ncbi:hypothetical protein BZA77DRAFT_85896 [Pyronema omphalodes]|nr:hypothetical protein BZA77DRAFT_85896 [Pyronema omphalodes]